MTHQTRSKTATKQRTQDSDFSMVDSEEEDCLQQQNQAGCSIIDRFCKPMDPRVPSLPSKGFLIALIVVTMAVIFMSLTEGQFRRVAPDSAWRPSIILTASATRAEAMFLWIGWQWGRFTNIYYWIKDLCVDFAAMIEPLCMLFLTPVYTVHGFADYYTQAYMGVSCSGGPLIGVCFSLAVCALCFSLIRRSYLLVNSHRK